MPNTPYAKVLASLGGGTPASGGIVSTTGTTVQFTAENSAFYTQQKWEIYDYPPTGFSCPSGWSTDTSGVYFSTALVPPAFTLGPWGKYMIRLTANGGLLNGQLSPNLVDESTAIEIVDPVLGLHDTAFHESNQFDPEDLWVGPMKKNWRAIADSLGDAVSKSGTISTGATAFATIPVPVDAVVYVEIYVTAKIVLPTPGILIPGALDTVTILANYGTSGPVQIGGDDDPNRTVANSAWISSFLTDAVVGNAFTFSVNAVVPVAFVSTHAYTGTIISPTTIPNAVGDGTNAFVTNGGNLYVVTVGGTDSGSAGPTGTGAGPITAGGLTYYYVGPASSGVSIAYAIQVRTRPC